MTTILEEARALEDDIVADRRWLHEHPEIGFDLPQTTAYVAERLREIGLEPEEIVPGGLVATIGDPSAGRCFMLRADMDALPLREETGLPFASQTDYMHACGHDTHTAMLLGAARILKGREAELPGCVKLMFQPDEEGCAPDEICGNEAMINAGVLENPHVDAATAIHLMPFDYRLGEIATRPGTGFSSIDDIDIVVHGKGGHGSRPHQLVDPFNIACHIFFGAQNLIARELDPNDQAVITFGAVNGGTAANIVPDDVHLLGTLRTIDEGTRAHLKQRMEEMCRGIAEGFGGSVDVRFLRGVPSVHNDPALTERADRLRGGSHRPPRHHPRQAHLGLRRHERHLAGRAHHLLRHGNRLGGRRGALPRAQLPRGVRRERVRRRRGDDRNDGPALAGSPRARRQGERAMSENENQKLATEAAETAARRRRRGARARRQEEAQEEERRAGLLHHPRGVPHRRGARHRGDVVLHERGHRRVVRRRPDLPGARLLERHAGVRVRARAGRLSWPW